ncbi:MAG TPA: ribonuclease P protein subunit [Pyrodictium sp.]|nr:ribonuclease P protein subunit [Pyrodictium sp.]
MRRSAWNIFFHELIGLRVRVLHHSDPTISGLEGTVVGETTNTLVIECRDGVKRVPKKQGVFLFWIPREGWVLVYGEEISGDSVERLKKLERLRGVGWLVRKSKERRYTRH